MKVSEMELVNGKKSQGDVCRDDHLLFYTKPTDRLEYIGPCCGSGGSDVMG